MCYGISSELHLGIDASVGLSGSELLQEQARGPQLKIGDHPCNLSRSIAVPPGPRTVQRIRRISFIKRPHLPVRSQISRSAGNLERFTLRTPVRLIAGGERCPRRRGTFSSNKIRS